MDVSVNWESFFWVSLAKSVRNRRCCPALRRDYSSRHQLQVQQSSEGRRLVSLPQAGRKILWEDRGTVLTLAACCDKLVQMFIGNHRSLPLVWQGGQQMGDASRTLETTIDNTDRMCFKGSSEAGSLQSAVNQDCISKRSCGLDKRICYQASAAALSGAVRLMK